MNTLDRLLVQVLPTIRAVVRRYARDKDHAEDLVQDCLLRIVEKWHTCSGNDEDTVRGWAWKLSNNLCRSMTRTKSVAEATNSSRDYNEIPDHAPMPDQQLERARRSSAIRRAVARLPKRSRIAIELVYLGELTPRDVASHLGVGVDAVRAMLVRGIQGLKETPELTAWAPVPERDAATDIVRPACRRQLETGSCAGTRL